MNMELKDRTHTHKSETGYSTRFSQRATELITKQKAKVDRSPKTHEERGTLLRQIQSKATTCVAARVIRQRRIVEHVSCNKAMHGFVKITRCEMECMCGISNDESGELCISFFRSGPPFGYLWLVNTLWMHGTSARMRCIPAVNYCSSTK